ncbi:monooxygenase [Palleronia sediminis]|uniref:Monooxygenase n=1 Tax=Palleronia sediminis TaxID=2547833 RepID=A0A4R6ALN9_9RHOB|nr:FAD-dependent monooxygenase [Palleronia sediminis]TDL84174.1 monooxygenase [Palleronia sediminis]
MSDVTVIGAGIAGLATGLALARRGLDAEIHEQAPELGEVGAGLQLSPNGMAVLDGLGVGEAIRAVSVRSRAVVLRAGGDTLLGMPQPTEFRMIARPALVEVLAAAAQDAGVRIVLGRRTDPDAVPTGAVVAADGLRSGLRAALNGPGAPRFSGQVAWRATVPGDAPPEAHVFTAPGRHLVRYPLAGGRVNLVGVEERGAWTEEGWRLEGDPAAFRAGFAGLAPELAPLLDRVETVHVWGLFLHPVARVWQDGRRALAGDAAHPTLPFLAQGANLALEDAWWLAAALAAPDRATGLRDYEAARRPRAERAIAAAAANARNYHLGGARRVAAHAALRAVGAVAPGAMLRRFDWLYGLDVTRERPLDHA